MPRSCTICIHPQASEIDRALIEGELSQRDVSRQFKITKTAVNRHFHNHLPARLVKAQDEKEIAGASDNLTRLEMLQIEAQDILRTAKAAKSLHIALEAIRELSRLIELQAKITGELRPEVNIILDPQYISMRTTILEVLQPYPDLRVKISEALRVAS